MRVRARLVCRRLREVVTIMPIDAPGECGCNNQAEASFAGLINWPNVSLFRRRFELLEEGNTSQGVKIAWKPVRVAEGGRLK
jgi:hypothetical protein